jgi:SWI/SNF-related matrix-associated actin-dependent regulator of chromatin subfamily A-like protein 1
MSCSFNVRSLSWCVLASHSLHDISNMQAQCTKNIVPLLARAKRAVLISGTPAMSKPAELMPQLRGLLPSYKFSNTEFAERYCVGDKFDALKGGRNLEELNMVLVCGLHTAHCSHPVCLSLS